MNIFVSTRKRAEMLLSSKPTWVLAACAFLPIVVIGLFGRYYSSFLQGIQSLDATNLAAIRRMLVGVYQMSDQGDSWVPMREALSVLHSDQADRLYELVFFTKSIRFQYPPTSLLPLELLSWLGVQSLGQLNILNFAIYCLNAAGVGVIAWQLFQVRPATSVGIPPRPESSMNLSPNGIAAIAVIAAFMFYPLVRAEILGQIQIWIDALFTLAIVFWLRDRRFFAGICLGLACAIKPQFGLLLIWGLLWRQVPFSSGMLVGILPVAAISLLRYGLHDHLRYLDVLAFLSRHGENFFANNSVNGILHAYFSTENLLAWKANVFAPYIPFVYYGSLVAALTSYALIAIPPLLSRGLSPGLEQLGAASICSVVGSPVAWEHHYGILLPLYFVALRNIWSIQDGSRRKMMLATLLVSWILVANFIPFALLLAQTPFRFVQAHCFFGALLLLYLLFATLPRSEGATSANLASGSRKRLSLGA